MYSKEEDFNEDDLLKNGHRHRRNISMSPEMKKKSIYSFPSTQRNTCMTMKQSASQLLRGEYNSQLTHVPSSGLIMLGFDEAFA